MLAAIDSPGVIRHIWITVAQEAWRSIVLEMKWDGAPEPAVRVPLGDFFCNGWCVFSQVTSATVCVNPKGGFNCYWPMPFKRSCEIAVVNLAPESVVFFYQVDYGLTAVPDDSLYFHCDWARSNPVEDGVHRLLRTDGAGRYVGTYLAWQSRHPGWWGEGEFKFYLDDDDAWPTICGTGTEDYFGGAWGFTIDGKTCTEYTTAYLGLNQALAPIGFERPQPRFGMYRWHLADDIPFESAVKVDVQALGLGPGLGNGLDYRYRILRDDVASTAFYYLNDPAGVSDQAALTPDLLQLEVD
ncbi:MAG: DUF2961 domain-containing protein [Bifidobacteriaceae bacterium]|nr:DUF2961 domain-containing protein [Bifidobacteriaceae bacterium]